MYERYTSSGTDWIAACVRACMDRMQERGLTPTVIESTINKGVAVPSRNSTFIYSADGIKVIVNEHGAVVTAMPQ